ncbi:SDR family NAD(P)-dependent oxidoreductase [Streptomyces acidiscabies]|uniref:SDR family NAD(P)-dependent oxidoreductase n=1 Tax=Streptomyces acidiscabies TaxID=42234 RepID=UPI0035A21F23
MRMVSEEKLVDYLKRVSADLHTTRQRLREAEERAQEPIAVVEMACRYPGGIRTPEALWDLVATGRHALGPFPENRGWDLAALFHPDPDHPGTTYAREGGFVHDADLFDPEFFGISPREAQALDPQQRLLLECAWEALERAGLDPRSLHGSRTGVYAGAALPGFGTPHLDAEAEGHLVTGSAPSVLSGRLAYTFGFEGPAVTIDTACSSSLVAVHLAAHALRQRECDLALAGGVTVMTTPYVFTEFSRQRGLAADGRCKPFADAADGTAFSEGAGLLVLERLTDARRAGHPILAVIRGSAVNQDGASNGLTAPNGLAQQRVIRAALAGARLSPAEIDAVEAHGTGTRLGDPIEADALLATYGQERHDEKPLWLGSVKSNLGHTQGAAGAAGLIKMILGLRHETLPATLHVNSPTAQADWASGDVRLLTEAVPWPRGERTRRAGVSSFGISGTNAHVILEEAPPEEPADEPVRREPGGHPNLPWLLSARTVPALRAHAGALAPHLDDPTAAVAATLSHRTLFEHRAVVLGTDREERAQALAALAEGRPHPALVRPPGAARTGTTAFLFTGQGSQRPGMGQELYAAFPAFAEALDDVCAHLDPALKRTLFAPPDSAEAAALNETGTTQTALFALETALYRLVTSFGVTPSHLTGHSVGEIAAAHAAGVLDLPDACTLVAARGRLMQALPPGGAMLAVQATETDVLPLLTDRLALAAVNGPTSVVISGDATQAATLEHTLRARGLRTKRLNVSHAFHSPLLDPMLDEFRAVVRELTFHPPTLPIVSNLTGALADAQTLADPEYWVRHVRRPVRFFDGVRALDAQKVVRYLELGPDPVLTTMVRDCLPSTEPVVTTALRTGHDETRTLLSALATLHTDGQPVDFTPLVPPGTDHPHLPTYPFQRRRYWRSAPHTPTSAVDLDDTGHPLLPVAVQQADGGLLFAGRLSPRTHPWLADHTIGGAVPFPGTAFLELALSAARFTQCDTIDDLTLETPLLLDDNGTVSLQLTLAAPDSTGRRTLAVHARTDDEWHRHATGTLTASTDTHPPTPTTWPPTDATPVDVDALYTRLDEQGYAYGPAFRAVRAAWRHGDDLYADVHLTEPADGFTLHPVLLDAALHAVDTLYPHDDRQVRLPFSFTGVRQYTTGATTLRAHLTALADDRLRLDLTDTDGAPVATIDTLRLRRIATGHWRTSIPLHHLEWQQLPFSFSGEASEAESDFVFAAFPAGDDPAQARTHAHQALRLVSDWLATDTEARLVVVTEGAVTARPDDPPPDLATAPLWGLVRAAQAEQPGRILLLDTDQDPASRAAQSAALAAATARNETQLALRDGTALVPRLAAVGQSEATAPELDPERAVLITGGTGGLGQTVARHLAAAHGARHLLLAGRRGPDAEGVAELRDDLAELGVEVEAVACDVTDPEALAELVGSRALTAVVHLAGIVDDSLVTAMTPDQLDAVLTPKADAAWQLHRLTQDMDLAAFVLFSSAGSVLGAAGQANYATANAFLDALAEHRRAEGLAATSIAWGLWESAAGGMAARLDDTDRARIRRTGVAALTDEQALGLFDAALTAARPAVLASRFDRAVLRDDMMSPVLRGLVRTPRPAPVTREEETTWAAHVAALPDTDRERALTELVREQVAIVLAHPTPGAIELDRAFHELGFDSLTSLELRNRLSTATGIRLPATLVFDHPTAKALVNHLRAQLPGAGAGAAKAIEATTVRAATDDDPIAIVGMACRYPGGVTSPEDLWRLVRDGGDAIGPFPENRGWNTAELFDPDPDQVGHSYTREGGFLYDAGEFDAEFFGISPREALAMDPQQRLLLETAWHAFEDAGIDPATLRGTSCGVITGIMYDDYGSRFLARKPEGFEGRIMTGSTPSVASGRVAYTFGLEGPAITVDTACSSSSVAIHLAAQALRQGECELALAGGVTVMATPNTFVEFSRQRGLAPDGRCKPFSAAADGTGWGEGAGLVVLERLSDARRRGHKVLALLRGSAVNQDGASNGLTAPNGPSQERVIRAALAGAGQRAADVDAVEAHGTGTVLGDPIEAGALLAVYGQGRAVERPLWLGSVKSNIGHTQAAAGVAGVIKMVMALRHEVLPVSLHAEVPSGHVEWDGGGVRLLSEAVGWPRGERVRRAGVSSFGISGTNAHLILEEAPGGEEGASVEEPEVVPWVVSARSSGALEEQVRRVRELEASAVEVGWSLVATRSVFEHRAVIVDGDVVSGVAGDIGPGPVLVFPGQGSQWVGMGAQLLDESPVFADRIAECEQALAPHVDWSLTEVLRGGRELDRVDVVQPVLWAVMVSLAAIWEGYGVVPAAVIGHSQGEIAAACVAGALSLQDAARIVAVRSDALRQLQGRGDMASIGTGPDEVRALIGDHRPGVSVAVVNSASSTVISGPPAEVAAVVSEAEARGLRARLIDVGYASHNAQIDELREELTRRLSDVRPSAVSDVAFYSTVTAGRIDTTALDTEYWVTNLREQVRFAETIAALQADGYRLFIEASPHPVLVLPMEETIDTGTVVPTLRRDHGGTKQLTLAAAQAFTAGADINWHRWFPTPPHTIDLPTYPFQHHHYWLAPPTTPTDATDLGMTPLDHPHLTATTELPASDAYLLTGRLTHETSPWLAEHVVAATPLVPGSALIEWLLRAADEAGCPTLDEVTLTAPLPFPDSGTTQLQITVGAADDEGRREVRVYARRDTAWVCHATGVASPEPPVPAAELAPEWPPVDADPVDVEDFYPRAAQTGYTYGPAFQGLRKLWRHGPDLFAEITLPEQAGPHDGFGIHPALLDAALHPLMLLDPPGNGRLWLPFAWTGVTLSATGATSVRVRLTPRGETVGVTITDSTGAPVLTTDALTLRAVAPGQLAAGVEGLYAVEWTPLTAPHDEGEETLVLAVDGEELPSVAKVLAEVQEFLDSSEESRLTVVTRGAVAVDGGDVDPSAAAVWGLVRSAQTEHPGRLALLDTDGGELPRLPGGEPQLALRDGALYVPRLTPVTPPDDLLPPPDTSAWRLTTTGPATLDALAMTEAPEALAPLAPGQVRISVQAAGVNFRDVLIALGMYPDEGTFGGSEGAGRVTEVGPGVAHLKAGDRVMGLFEGAFGTLVVADARMIVPVPEGMSLREAAAVPVVFLTAWYGLVELGGLGAGESLLVHAGTGGVGMAAVQIARHLGAEVYATASPAKHAVLAELGIDEAHRASSRDLGFAEKFRGRVDLVLNSLAGEFTDASLRLLAGRGRMVDMGKTDKRDAGRVAAEYGGVPYRAFDLVPDAGPVRIGEMLAELGELFASGALTPLPVRSWPVGRAREAFRFMSQAQHTGKLVLDIPPALDPDGTVLITGGTGVLGTAVAEHLVREWGVRRLVLASRSGGGEGVVEGLDADVSFAAVDVTDADAVAELVACIEGLTGVVHAAGVLDDAVVTAQTPESLAKVWAVKAAGARHLHEATRDLGLDLFVVFSSAAATLGSPGQANYAAANAYCDALMQHRRAEGLPGLSIGWGLWRTASGMTGHLNDTDLARMKRTGFTPLTTEHGLALLDAARAQERPHVIAVDLDVRAVAAPPPPLLRALATKAVTARRTAATGTAAVDGFADRLAALPPAGRHRLLLDLVRSHAAGVLGHADHDAIRPDTSFKELGFDSLTAVELRNRLAAATGLKLPAALVFDHPESSALAGHLLERLDGTPAPPKDPVGPLLGELGRIESSLTTLALDDEARGRITRRLTTLLTKLNGAPDLEALDTVSDDEMFELIDREL